MSGRNPLEAESPRHRAQSSISHAGWHFVRVTQMDFSIEQSGGARSAAGAACGRPADWFDRFFLGAALLAAVLAFPIPWPDTSFMPDTLGYAEAVSQGRWVAHAPGYPLFVAMGRMINLAVADPVTAVQWASFLLYAGSILFLYFGTKRLLGSGNAMRLLAAYVVSWIPLYFSRSGTNHAADLFVAALMLNAAFRPGFGKQGDGGIWAYSLGMALSAGFRLPSFIMLAPFFAAVFFVHCRKWRVWVGYVLAAAIVVGLQAFAVACFGGWEAFRQASASLAGDTDKTSVLLSGLTTQSMANLGRSGIWYAMTVAVLLPIPLMAMVDRNRRAFFRNSNVLITLCSIAGPLAVNALYLSTHPGYLAVAVPGTFWLVALSWQQIDYSRWAARLPIASALASICCFFGFHVFSPPSSASQAVANGFLLQYSRDGIERRVWRPTAEWMLISGNRDMVPSGRQESLKGYLEFRKRIENRNP